MGYRGSRESLLGVDGLEDEGEEGSDANWVESSLGENGTGTGSGELGTF